MTTPRFVEFKTEDGLTLPGLLYASRGTKRVAIDLHGNGSSSIFYEEKIYRQLANRLKEHHVALFPFNNRGAHLIKKLNVEKNGKTERKRYGMAYEKIKECVEDINGAIEFLNKLGYREFFLIGASTGANKVCVYNHYQPINRIKKYVLLSGGDDMGGYYSQLGKSRFFELLNTAKEKIKRGEGENIITELLPEEFFSYLAFYDTCNPDGDYNTFPFYEKLNGLKLSRKPLFRYFKAIKKPTLVVYGEKDEYCYGKLNEIVKILKSYQPRFTYHIIKNADHGFSGHEDKLDRIIADWLA